MTEEDLPTTAARELQDVLGLVHDQNQRPGEVKTRRDARWDLEDDSERRQKWSKVPAQKGSQGKGHSAWDQWRPHQDDWFQNDPPATDTGASDLPGATGHSARSGVSQDPNRHDLHVLFRYGFRRHTATNAAGSHTMEPTVRGREGQGKNQKGTVRLHAVNRTPTTAKIRPSTLENEPEVLRLQANATCTVVQ